VPSALVTGASRGIGLALLRELGRSGHAVTGTRRGTAAVAGADDTGSARWLHLDATVAASAGQAAAAFGPGPLDLLVCNAGVYPDRTGRIGTAAAPGDRANDMAEAFAVNATGVILTIEAFLPALRRAQAAKIAIISSQMGSTERAPGGSYAYRASKAAAVNIGRNLARDLSVDGIAVGIYHPGWVRTDMGGAGADIDVDTSARGLVSRFSALGPATSGCFEDFAGRAIPF
jgi:NAD(P)-dependent dehydrogenase (short-subunit alcohol dehydrogenase family)